MGALTKHRDVNAGDLLAAIIVCGVRGYPSITLLAGDLALYKIAMVFGIALKGLAAGYRDGGDRKQTEINKQTHQTAP
jgi:hypothetical protein